MRRIRNTSISESEADGSPYTTLYIHRIPKNHNPCTVYSASFEEDPGRAARRTLRMLALFSASLKRKFETQ